MNRNEKYTSNECIAYKSLPNILFPTKSSKISQSKSLPSCLKFAQRQSQYDKRVPISNIMYIENTKINLIKKKKSNPTIGELLGDDDLFHYHYHNQYSSPRSKRKRYHHHHHRSYSRSSYIHVHYGRRKQRRSNYLNTMKEPHHPPLSSTTIESIPDTNQVYPYPTIYSYTPFPTYCYYCYSNMASCCPCLISDCYGGFYQNEICYETSTS